MKKTSIPWTDATWNPIRGCSKVSPGCDHCYAERMAARFCGAGMPYEGLVDSDGRWNGETRLIDGLLDLPARWRKPRRIFVNSMSDLFHEAIPDEDIYAVLAGIVLAKAFGRGHVFQILTKRPARMLLVFQMLATKRGRDHLEDAADAIFGEEAGCHVANSLSGCLGKCCNIGWPFANVWLGVTAENQQTANERIPLLLQTPAALRFISVEPMLDQVGIKAYCPSCLGSLIGSMSEFCGTCCGKTTRPDWIICGGESGPVARPMHPEWVRSLRDQCQAGGVPFFFKQASGLHPLKMPTLDGQVWDQMPEVRR